MTKALVLNVTYSARYGQDVDETMLLPLDVNGVLFNKLDTDVTLYDVVSLGEIEGKHSECFGDLTVNVVDLDKLNSKESADLINISYFGEFESFFEEIESEFIMELDEESEEGKNAKDAINQLLDKYEIDKNSYGITTSKIHDKFIEILKEKYTTKFQRITVSENDYKKAIELLKSNGVDIF